MLQNNIYDVLLSNEENAEKYNKIFTHTTNLKNIKYNDVLFVGDIMYKTQFYLKFIEKKINFNLYYYYVNKSKRLYIKHSPTGYLNLFFPNNKFDSINDIYAHIVGNNNRGENYFILSTDIISYGIK